MVSSSVMVCLSVMVSLSNHTTDKAFTRALRQAQADPIFIKWGHW